MALHRATTTFQAQTNNPEDVTTNTLYFDADDDPALDDVQVAIEAFYESFRQKISNLMRNTGIVTEYYRLSDPEPRRPVKTEEWDLAGLGTGTLPTEVALVLSYEASPISGVPQARRRGRIYLGPLDESVNGNDGYVDGSAITALRSGALGMLNASDAATNWTWSTYSPTNAEGYNVVRGWIDDSFDTQRRRGRAANSRSTWPV